MSKVIIILLIFIVIFGGGYFFLNGQRLLPNMTKASPSPSASPTTSAEIIPTDKSMNDLMAGGSSYADPNGVFSFLYPNDYKFDTQNNDAVVRVYKQGPTQQGQTEMYDGIIVTFEKITLNNQNLSSWLDQELKSMKENGVSEVTEPKKAVTVNGNPGFSYAARGLGEFKFLVLQKDPSSPNAIRVTAMVSDPTNAGFQKQADQIISSIKIVK